MLLILAFVLLLAFALFVNALLRPITRVGYALGLFVLVYAGLVLVSEAASLLGLIGAPFFMAAEILLALAAWWVWRCKGKPALLGPFTGGQWRIWQELPPFRTAAALWLLGLGVGLIYLAGAVIIPLVPPNNYDSLTYHISRVGYWMQHGSLAPWLTPNLRQASFPINTELGLLWAALFWGSDQLFGYLQWLSTLVCLVAIFGLARLLGANRGQSLFAALVWAAFPQVLLQSTSTQNDLVTTALFSAFLYLLYRGLQSGERGALVLGGLAFGLAVGAKSTIVLILPGLALALLAAWWRGGRVGFRRLFTWGLAGIVGFGLLGAYGYVQNALAYGDALNITELSGGGGAATPVPRTVSLLSNSTLYLYQFVDLTGLPNALAAPLLDYKARAAQKLINILNLPVETGLLSAQFSLNQALRYPVVVFEDTSWFGLLAPLLLIPAFFYQLWVGLRRKEPLRLGLIVLGVGFWLVYAAFFGWTPYKGRYFILTTGLLAPLLAFIYPSRSCKGWKAGLTHLALWLVTLASLWIGGFTLLNNASKPLVGLNAIWGKDEISLRTINNPAMKSVIEMVEAQVPPTATIATRLGGDDWDTVLFGRSFGRRLIQADPFSIVLDLEGMRREGAAYLLVNPTERSFLKMPSGLSFLGEVQGWTLFALDQQPQVVPDAATAEKLLGASDAKKLITVAPELVGKVGITAFSTGQWEVENFEGQSLLWLGEKEIQGLRMTLWSEQAQSVRLAFDIQPGPGRADQERQVSFIFYRRESYRRLAEGSLREVRLINSPTRLAFTLPLQHGSNEVLVRILDAVTIRKQANGDERALMAMVRNLTISAAP